MLHRLILAALGLAFTLAVPTTAVAHDGHKMMGTVTMAAADHVIIKTTDGKDITIAVSPKTKVLRGKTPVKITDIKEGTRIVATVSTHTARFTASRIDVGQAPQTAQKK